MFTVYLIQRNQALVFIERELDFGKIRVFLWSRKFPEYWVYVRLINSLVFAEVNYITHKSPMNYQDAQTFCKLNNGSLASLADQDDIKSMKDVMSRNSWHYWTGLQRANSNSSWTFADGTNAEFALSKFSRTPDEGDCVQICGNEKLRQAHCTEGRPFICQVTATPPGER